MGTNSRPHSAHRRGRVSFLAVWYKRFARLAASIWHLRLHVLAPRRGQGCPHTSHVGIGSGSGFALRLSGKPCSQAHSREQNWLYLRSLGLNSLPHCLQVQVAIGSDCAEALLPHALLQYFCPVFLRATSNSTPHHTHGRCMSWDAFAFCWHRSVQYFFQWFVCVTSNSVPQ